MKCAQVFELWDASESYGLGKDLH